MPKQSCVRLFCIWIFIYEAQLSELLQHHWNNYKINYKFNYYIKYSGSTLIASWLTFYYRFWGRGWGHWIGRLLEALQRFTLDIGIAPGHNIVAHIGSLAQTQVLLLLVLLMMMLVLQQLVVSICHSVGPKAVGRLSTTPAPLTLRPLPAAPKYPCDPPLPPSPPP